MKSILRLTIVIGCIAVLGCQEQTETVSNSSQSPTGTQYLTDVEPANSTPVGDARKSAKDGDSVSLVGHIGGSSEPFVDGIAAFTIVDTKIPYCQPEENCPKPWDYCCTQNEVKDNIATIKIVNEQGSPVMEHAKQLLGVKELSLVVVEGKAKRDDQGNFSVLASKVFIKKQ